MAVDCTQRHRCRDVIIAHGRSRPLFDAMQCPKTFVQFTADDGAAQHCEGLNRTLAMRAICDWLDETLGATA